MRSVPLAALALVAASAFGQGQFPDVPANHWAYAALARMKRDGLLVGYPDGLFRGGRSASRYELAVALHAAYAKLKELIDGEVAQINALLNPGDYDGAALRDAVALLQDEVEKMKGIRADVADLQRASNTFELELTQLGVDVQAMKDGLRGLATRVGALEKRPEPIEISGDLNLWLGGGHTDGDHYGLTRDGRLTGTLDKGPQAGSAVTRRAGITQDLAFLNEAAFRIESKPEKGPRFEGTFVVTNAFGSGPVDGTPAGRVAFGNQSDVFNPTGGVVGKLYGYAEGTGDVYLENLFVAFDGRAGSVRAGRVEHRATPWTFQRLDNTLYFDNERWDNGLYGFDGVVADGRLGRVKATVYGGSDNDESVKGVEIDPLRTGPAFGHFGPNGGNRLRADRLLGGTLATTVGGLELRADALSLGSDEPVPSFRGEFDRVDVFGGEGSFRLGRFRAEGGLRRTQAHGASGHVRGLGDDAWDAKVAYASGRFDLWGQYRQVGLNYTAPGDWGCLGVLRNPTNVRGFLGSAKVALCPRLDLGLEGETSHGLDSGDAAGSFLGRDTDIGRYAVRLEARLGHDWDTTVYYENTHFSGLVGAATGGARYQWYGVGLVHDLSANALFRLGYEQSAVRDDYQTTAGESFRGGFLTSQVTIRF